MKDSHNSTKKTGGQLVTDNTKALPNQTYQMLKNKLSSMRPGVEALPDKAWLASVWSSA